MRVKTFNQKIAAQVALVILWQVIMVACYHLVGASHERFLSAVVIASWLVPFVGYLVAVYGTSLLAKWPRALRAGLFALSSLVFTFFVYLVLSLSVDIIKDLRHH